MTRPAFRTAAVVFLLLAAASVLALEPPSPGELERYRQDGTLEARMAFAKSLGNYKVSPDLVARSQFRLRSILAGNPEAVYTPPSGWRGMPTTGTVNVLAVLIQFSDYSGQSSNGTITANLFLDGNGGYPYESLRNFYRRASYNQLEITGSVLGWYGTTYPRSSVPQSDWGREALIKEALNQFDSQGFNFAPYDNDNDGVIDYLVVIWAGPDNGWGNFWWGYQTTFSDSSYTLDGKRLHTYSWQWESRPWPGAHSPRVVIHETGHALGLPDYYDYDDSVGPDGGVGWLDQMDANWGDHNCWSKFLLDWLTPTVYGSGTHSATLQASGTSQDCLLVMPSSTGSEFGEFYMVQNRYRTANDGGYPADGLLIWHVDSTLNGAGTDYVYDNSWTSHKLLRLMEADGLEEIETGDGKADAGDYYVSGKSLGPSTAPNSNAYSGSQTGLVVDSISAPGTSMSCNVTLPGGGGCTVTCTATVPSSASVGAAVSFSSTATATGCTGSPSYSWSFGDGGTSSSQNTTHAYTTAGTYGWSLTVNASGITCNRSGSIVVGGGGGSNVLVTWSAPAPGGVNPPQNVQATRTAAEAEAAAKQPLVKAGYGAMIPVLLGSWSATVADDGAEDRSETTVTETEPNGCISLVGFTEPYQTLYSGDTLYGSVQLSDTSVCLVIPYTGGDEPLEDLFGFVVSQTATFTITLSFSGGADLDIFLADLNGYILNPSCGNECWVGAQCENPETFSVSLSPGTYLLAINLATVLVCSGSTPADTNYTLTITGGGGSGPVLQGYNVYRATTNTDSAYSQVSSTLGTSTLSFTDASAPTSGVVYYRVRALYDTGLSGWSNTATVGGSSVTPPSVTAMQKLGNPFRIQAYGSNLQPGIRVFIDGAEWGNVVWKSSGTILLKGGASLKAAVPKYTTHLFRFLNPDGGEMSGTWGWP